MLLPNYKVRKLTEAEWAAGIFVFCIIAHAPVPAMVKKIVGTLDPSKLDPPFDFFFAAYQANQNVADDSLEVLFLSLLDAKISNRRLRNKDSDWYDKAGI